MRIHLPELDNSVGVNDCARWIFYMMSVTIKMVNYIIGISGIKEKGTGYLRNIMKMDQ